MSDEVEYTLTQLPQVHVFKIPPRSSAEGYRAADWPKDPAWTGKLRIVAKGKIASIILYDDKNPTFAVCTVTDSSCVEKVLDSGRYFVLKITNAQGRHAFIGIAFNERNDSFDFNVALSEHRSQIEREEQAAKGVSSVVAPMLDLSLKEGEKIKIKINKPHKEGADVARSPAKPSGGGFLLPPPKKGNVSAPTVAATSATLDTRPAAATTASSSNPFGASDPFGDNDPFGGFETAAAPGATSSAAPSSAFTFVPSSTADGGFSTDPFASSSTNTKSSTQDSGSTNLLDF